MRSAFIICVLAACLLVPSIAAADDSGWYVGLAATHSDYGSLPEVTSDIPGTSHKANGWAVIGGYQVIPWFSWEASYFDLGSVSAHSQQYYFPGSIASRPKLTGESFDAVFKLDLPQGFFVFGKGGMTLSKLDQPGVSTISYTPGHTTVTSYDSSASYVVLDYGAGLGYETGNSWTVRLGWTRYPDVGDVAGFSNVSGPYGGQGNVNSLHLDLIYRF